MAAVIVRVSSLAAVHHLAFARSQGPATIGLIVVVSVSSASVRRYNVVAAICAVSSSRSIQPTAIRDTRAG